MDELVKNTLLWVYISVAAMIGVGVVWIVSLATFWMFPEITEQVTASAVVGLLLMGGMWSVITAFWTFVSILGWRRLKTDVERWLKRNKVDY